MARDYTVGFGKPPLQHCFKPGQSGNPAGRKPGEKSFQKLLARELDERVRVKLQGQHRLLSRREILIKRAVADAMAGNPKILAMVVANDPMAAAAVADEIASAVSRPVDETVKQDFLRRIRHRPPGADVEKRVGICPGRGARRRPVLDAETQLSR